MVSYTLTVYAVAYFLLAQLLHSEAAFFTSYCQFLEHELVKEIRRNKRASPKRPVRKSWSELEAGIPDKHFRRMFRMSKPSFYTLCDKISNKIGDETFRSESYHTKKQQRTAAAIDARGGVISGELKVAVTLRLFAGGSYLDIFLGYDVSTSSNYVCFHDVCEWICDTFQFPLLDWLKTKDVDSLINVSDGFSRFTAGVFRGCIGAIDGLAIRIRCPCDLQQHSAILRMGSLLGRPKARDGRWHQTVHKASLLPDYPSKHLIVPSCQGGDVPQQKLLKLT